MEGLFIECFIFIVINFIFNFLKRNNRFASIPSIASILLLTNTEGKGTEVS